MKIKFVLPAILFMQIIHSQQIAIIPQPQSVQAKPGKFEINDKTVLVAANADERKSAEFFNSYLKEFYALSLPVVLHSKENCIQFTKKVFVRFPDKDGYTLEVSDKKVIISGDTYAGTFYGMQTLIQLLPLVKNKSLSIPQVNIEDAPRFSYRGMHLDAGRHFMPVSFIKKYIDYIALHKMNYFHWHLTEDQGWRIEIKKYPELTSVGAYRNGTVVGHAPGTSNDNIRYGGYYTQEEIKDVVKYASDRYISIIPEIEMPGHSSAAIAAYPWLSCFPEEKTKIKGPSSDASDKSPGKAVQESWGVFPDIYCAGKDSTFQFLENVLNEVITLFPSKYIHVGGDESPKENWKRCPRCQARIKQLGLKDEHELQSYFIQRMEKYINSRGKTLIGWDEILEGGLAPNAIVMSWRGEEGGITAARQNHKVIMTPTTYVYFDYSESKPDDSLTIGGNLPLTKVYDYDPVPNVLNNEQGKLVLGSQGNVWSEYMSNPAKVEYMIFPRMSALSEVVWTEKGKKNYGDFKKRLAIQVKRYELWNAHYNKVDLK